MTETKKHPLLIVLDSGAFSAERWNKPIDIDAYIQFIKDHDRLIYKYFNLDVLHDGIESYKNWVYMRSKGLDPIPIYHMGTDIRFLHRYMAECETVAIGAIANMSTARRVATLDEIWANELIDKDGYPKNKFHGLGLNSLSILIRFPWFSVDSTSWVQYGQFGVILVPRWKGGRYVYDENPFRVCVSSRSPAQKDLGKHFYNYTKIEQERILQYIEAKGFTMGSSIPLEEKTPTGRPKEQIVELGLCNREVIRDELNMIYFSDLCKSLPEYPWPFKGTNHGNLFCR